MGLKMNIVHTRVTVVDNTTINVKNLLKSHRHNQQCEKMKWSWPVTPTASKTIDGPRVSQLGDHTTKKDAKRDMTNDGETTRTNTRGARSGRGHRKTD